LAAVRAAVEVSEGVARGAELGSKELYFKAGAVKAGEYSFRIGSAGSATLVLQTLLPALLSAGAPSRVFFEGGNVHGVLQDE
jgi:RNA 3'-terminal phosphate cyclase (ATP)